MATNLVSQVMQFLTPDMIGRIATALGLDRNNVQPAIGAAVPALLAGLSSVAAQPGGAQKLADVARQQNGALGNFAGMLAAGGQTSFAEKGSQMLSSLFGSRDESALVTAVGKFAGLGQSASNSLLGLLAPVVLGSVAQQGSRDLSANGVAGLLANQKDSIAAALPSGFGNLLSGTGLLDSVGGSARTAAAAASQTARGAASAAYAVGNAGQRAAGAATSASPNWLVWLIPLLAVAALLVYLFARPAEQAVQKGVTAVQGLTVDGLDLGKQVTDSVGSLRTTLTGITDAASAQAALPKLQELAGQVDKVSGRVGQLSVEQRKMLAGVVSPTMTTLSQLIDKVLAVPGVAAIIKPTLDTMKAKLAALAA
jgi:hypothetical protein